MSASGIYLFSNLLRAFFIYVGECDNGRASSEFFSHRAEIEVFVTQPVGGGGEPVLDALLAAIGIALAADHSLGGLAENLFWSAPETSVLTIEGAAPILTARITVTIEYLVSDPLAA